MTKLDTIHTSLESLQSQLDELEKKARHIDLQTKMNNMLLINIHNMMWRTFETVDQAKHHGFILDQSRANLFEYMKLYHKRTRDQT